MSANKRNRTSKPKRRRKGIAALQQTSSQKFERRAMSAFWDDDDAERALELFEQAEASGPLSESGLHCYLAVLNELQEFDQYARIALTLVHRHPDDAEANMFAGAACISTMQPVSAFLYWEKLIRIAPNHPTVDVIREEFTTLQEHLPEILEAFIDELPKDPPRIASVENILHFFKLGRFDDVIRRCQRHLQRYPNDLRIRNNLAEAFAMRGDLLEALEVFNETIQRAPENFYARASRSKLLYCLNRKADSAADAQHLRRLVPRLLSDLAKAAQAFAFRGDEDGIAWAYELAKQNDWLDVDTVEVALLLHFEATRLARAEQVAAAKPLWKRANKIAGPAVLAQANLDDLRKPIGRQNGPFYFEVREWLSSKRQRQMVTLADADLDDKEMSAKRLSNLMDDFLHFGEEIAHLVPDMLDRGDESTVELVKTLAQCCKQEGTRSAMIAYVTGTRGTDSMRCELASVMHSEGILDSETIELYVRGKKERIEFMNFEVTDEPTIPNGRDKSTQQRTEKAIEFLREGDGVQAEKLFRQLVQDHPDAPDFKNNLAMALEIQGKKEESDLLIDEVIEKYPDYFFGQIAVANRALVRGDYESALQTLTQLQRRKELHMTELGALAGSLVRTFVGRQDFPSAERWLGIFKEYDPDHPSISQLENLILVSKHPAKRFLGAWGAALRR